MLSHVLLHGPTPPSSGRLSPLVLILPTHLSAICNLRSLLKLGISNQPAPVCAIVDSTLQLLSNPVCLPLAETSPVRLPACCRTPPVRLPACCRTLLLTHRLSDPSPVRLPACCRTLACPTTHLLPNPRLSDYLPVAEPSPVWLPACCRTLAWPSLCPNKSHSFHPVSASLCPAFGSTRPVT